MGAAFERDVRPSALGPDLVTAQAHVAAAAAARAIFLTAQALVLASLRGAADVAGTRVAVVTRRHGHAPALFRNAAVRRARATVVARGDGAEVLEKAQQIGLVHVAVAIQVRERPKALLAVAAV